MVSIFKSRWFKFVVRTLFDWVLLIFLFLLAGYVKNTIIAPPKCTYDSDFKYDYQRIEELEDSVKKMKEKLDVYEQAVKWFRNADEDELQRGIEQIRSIPKDVPIP